jgi:hypothetical protein
LLQKERSEKFIFNLETQAVELKGLSWKGYWETEYTVTLSPLRMGRFVDIFLWEMEVNQSPEASSPLWRPHTEVHSLSL